MQRAERAPKGVLRAESIRVTAPSPASGQVGLTSAADLLHPNGYNPTWQVRSSTGLFSHSLPPIRAYHSST